MKKNLRIFFSISLLASSLILLSGCDWIKDKMGCKSCPAPDSKIDDKAIAPTSNAILTLKNKAVVTEDSFEDFWTAYTEGNPNAALIMQIYPNIREDIYKNTIKPLKVASAWVKTEGRDKDPEFQKKVRRQCEFVEDALALELLKNEVEKNIDKSDVAIEKFFNENKNKLRLFQRPPFIKKPAGIEAQVVEFGTEKEAQDFLEKAQKEGSDFSSLAKSVNKEVKNLGIVTEETKDIEPLMKIRIVAMQPKEIEKIDIDKDKFAVVKALSKQEPEYATFKDIKENPEARQMIEQQKIQVELSDQIKKKIDDLVKEYEGKEDLKFFEKEREQRQAEMEALQKQFEEERKKTEKEGAVNQKNENKTTAKKPVQVA